MYTYMCIYIYIYICIYVYIYTCLCIYLYIYKYIIKTVMCKITGGVFISVGICIEGAAATETKLDRRRHHC